MTTDYTADLDLALRLADASDAITRDRFGALDLKVDDKPDLSPVSDADLAVERTIREMLGEQRPDDAVLGEEFGITAQVHRWERERRLPHGPEWVARRLCLPAERVGEVAEALATIPPRRTAAVTLVWTP